MTTDKTPATLAVDVLAAMQELEDELQSAANYSGEGCYWSRDDDDLLRRSGEARAAVAELIEAGKVLQAASDAVEAARQEYRPLHVPMDVQSALNRALRSAQERFNAALARVKGESA